MVLGLNTFQIYLYNMKHPDALGPREAIYSGFLESETNKVKQLLVTMHLLWNTFPGHMRKAVTLSSFKSGYKTLFTLAFQ